MSWVIKKKYSDILANEEGWQKKLWGDLFTVCLVYPNVYQIGMSNLGFHTIYKIVNDQANFLCERAFLPDPRDEEIFAAGSLPLFSIESQKPVCEFDIVAFSIPFENDYINILKIMNMSRIDPSASRRGEKSPLVIGGGICVTLNPEPLAHFFDLFLLGEGEEVILEFLHKYEDSRRVGLKKEEMLLRFQQEIEGAYVPELYNVIYNSNHTIEKIQPLDVSLPEKIKKRWIRRINDFATGQCIITPLSEFKDVFLTEVSRGCGHGCRFCASGYVYRPARSRDMCALESSFLHGISKGKKIGLLGTAVSDHPGLLSMCDYITSNNGGISFGSLRVDRIDKDISATLKKTGAETISMAPEAGSQRLRDAINKRITEDQIISAVEFLIESGISNLKLYFMTGLPTETENDVDAIITLVKRIQHHVVKLSRGGGFKRITLSINQFIPKPVTPFQWHPLEDVSLVNKRVQKIKRALHREPSLTVIHDIPKWNYIQALFSLGDRRVGEIILTAYKLRENWSKAFKDVNVNPDFYVYRMKNLDEILPWDFIDHGVDKKMLASEYEKSLS